MLSWVLYYDTVTFLTGVPLFIPSAELSTPYIFSMAFLAESSCQVVYKLGFDSWEVLCSLDTSNWAYCSSCYNCCSINSCYFCAKLLIGTLISLLSEPNDYSKSRFRPISPSSIICYFYSISANREVAGWKLFCAADASICIPNWSIYACSAASEMRPDLSICWSLW